MDASAETPLMRLSDSEWMSVLAETDTAPLAHGVKLPSWPPPEIQERFVGSSGEAALREAFAFYKLVQAAVAGSDGRIPPDSRILDFGCGWGRIGRVFLRDVPSRNLYGVDVMPLAIEVCQATGCAWNLRVIEDRPPLPFADGTFDLIAAYSVFSHLPPFLADAWVAEFERVLRRGGTVVLTSRGETFLDYVDSLTGRERKPTQQECALLSKLGSVGVIRSRYRAGEFVFLPTGGGDNLSENTYGEAFVPKQYMHRRWAKNLQLVQFIAEPPGVPQNVAVLRKRRKSKSLAPLRERLRTRWASRSFLPAR